MNRGHFWPVKGEQMIPALTPSRDMTGRAGGAEQPVEEEGKPAI